MNQSPLGWPVALSTISDTASAGAISEMDMGDSCKISMLWNWNTIDACFISKSWRITSHGMFAGSCIGVILLVMALEFLRRLSKEYDRYILQQFKQSITLDGGGSRTAQKSTPKLASTTTATATADSSDENNSPYCPTNPTNAMTIPAAAAATIPFRPSLIQQSIRAFLHMITFAIAYFIMLLAMYYNGYFIICIFIGAYLGAFVFTWESVGVSMGSGMTGTAAMEDVTVCCG